MSEAFQRGSGDILIVHTSDVHVHSEPHLKHGDDIDDGVVWLRRVVNTARRIGANAILLAGDTFDHNRLPEQTLRRAADVLAGAAMPIVFLPGNHDPLTPDSVFRRGRLEELPDVRVLGLSNGPAVVFPELELEIWGRAHVDYSDMEPLAFQRPRSTRWQIAAAHGHFKAPPIEAGRFYGSWLIREEQINATGADYVALGHWNISVNVGNGGVPAHYSGSPEMTGTVHAVTLSDRVGVHVEAVTLAEDTP